MHRATIRAAGGIQGFRVSSHAPHGHGRGMVQDGPKKGPTPEVCPDVAPIVRRMFDMVEAGNGPLELIRTLNNEGIASPRGELWRRTSDHDNVMTRYARAYRSGESVPRTTADPVRVERASRSLGVCPVISAGEVSSSSLAILGMPCTGACARGLVLYSQTPRRSPALQYVPGSRAHCRSRRHPSSPRSGPPQASVLSPDRPAWNMGSQGRYGRLRGISKTAWDRRIYRRGTLMADPQVVRVSQHIRDRAGPKGRLLMQPLDSVHRDVNARANPTVAQRGKWSPAGVPFNCPGERRTYPNGLDFPHSLAEAVCAVISSIARVGP